ncbi:hypothetical protein C9374_008728 [Naegleria lovaniensis]|uniref:Clathrin/coatomer adaptor adaptin-like N-terminal domain-containing protein n=1 Tax=Naegleria lovaniensis TaxID=51637 RepID=A0AA88GJ18_NAELO|nr:uncharacterized protein C9374_008728 [Naegleria lovaniensis]KAG2378106.1 hypothetical protein C9374_008728 [Naegleria lovaniensis]
MFKITELVSSTFSQASSVITSHLPSVISGPNLAINSSTQSVRPLTSSDAHSNFDAISEDFAQFIERIGKVHSRELENEVILKMKIELRAKLSQHPNLLNDRYEMKEVILRLLYCEMMGHSTEHFAAIHVVNFCALSDLTTYEKRLAYLTLTLLLHRNHELMLLMINVLQKDLKSSRYLNVISALIASSKLINLETIPAILPFVVSLLKHQRSEVRKRAILTLHSFYLLEREEKCNKGESTDYLQYIELSLNDFDTSVLHVAMCFLCDYAADCHIQLLAKQREYLSQQLIEIIPEELKTIDKRVLKLSQVLVSILNQIVECNIFSDYIYGKLPAPWFQIKALQCLSLLGRYNKQVSQEMYEIIKSTYKRAEKAKNDIGTAVMFQCIKTATNIFPSPQLLNFIFDAVTRYLWNQEFKTVNERYISLEMLRMVLKANPGLVSKHQDMVIDSLDSHDETIQKLTTRLLVKMVNRKNVKLIVDRLTKYVKYVISVNDLYMAEEVIRYIIVVLEKYGMLDVKWYISALINFLQMVGNERNAEGKPLISENATSQFVRLSLKWLESEEDETIQFVCNFLYRMLEDVANGCKDGFSNSVCTLAVCVLKGMNYVLGDETSILPSIDKQVDVFIGILESSLDLDSCVKCYSLNALMDIYANANGADTLFEKMENSLSALKSSKNEEIVERTYQLYSIHNVRKEFCGEIDYLSKVFSREEVSTDSELPFLKSYVIEQVKKGASLYSHQKQKEVLDSLLTASSRANKPLIIKTDNINPQELNFKSDQVRPTNEASSKKSKVIWGPEDSIMMEEDNLNDTPELVKKMEAKLKAKQNVLHCDEDRMNSHKQAIKDFVKSESHNLVSTDTTNGISTCQIPEVVLQETEEPEMKITITC